MIYNTYIQLKKILLTTMENSETEDHEEALHTEKGLAHKLEFDTRNVDLQSIVPNPSIRDYMAKKLPFLSRKKRAAVLICIFSGREGELRVILTRRSMKLSSHPGTL